MGTHEKGHTLPLKYQVVVENIIIIISTRVRNYEFLKSQGSIFNNQRNLQYVYSYYFSTL